MPPRKKAAAQAKPTPMDVVVDLTGTGDQAAAAAVAAAAATPAVPKVDAAAEGTQLMEANPNVFELWQPSKHLVDRRLGAPHHPSPAVESGLLASVPMPPFSYDTAGLPDVADGRLSALQVESVLYAGQRHCLLVPAPPAPAKVPLRKPRRPAEPPAAPPAAAPPLPPP